AWGIAALQQLIRAGRVPEARGAAAALLPFWRIGAVRAMREKRRGFLDKVLRVALGLDAPALAASLLQPFGVEALTPGQAPALVALVKRYGEGWARPLLAEWSSPHSMRFDGKERLSWLASLPL
ncbi:MAG: hypothetical protein M3O15_06910, partial [Acidobacteriota bacterium]|nr:hypothetical protein [Acidobacteriota bacterium]